MTVALGPARYAEWRASRLGAVVESIEQRLILRLVGDVAGRRILDAGCGDGVLAVELARRGADATGVDADPDMIEAARSRAEAVGAVVAFRQGALEKLPFPDATFDALTAVTVLCLVGDPVGALGEMARVLKPGGRLVIGELGRWSPWAARRRIKGWLGSSLWRAARFRSARELRALVAAAGLRVEAVEGAVYFPPVTFLARLLAPLDPWLARRTTVGAAFIAVAAVKTTL